MPIHCNSLSLPVAHLVLGRAPLRVAKRRQLFIGPHNEPLSVAAMRVNNPDCSPVRIYS